jgi:hypothetical protein
MKSIKGYYQHLLHRLSQPNAVKCQLMIYMRIFGRDVEYFHSSNLDCVGRNSDVGGSTESTADRRLSQSSIEDTTPATESGMGWFFKSFTCMRVFTTAWMIYIIIRDHVLSQIGSPTIQVLGHKMPLRCYLLGNYITYDTISQITSFVFALVFILWRCYHAARGPYNLDLMRFFHLNENELETFYASLDSNQSIQLSPHDMKQLCQKQQYLLELMCYKIRSPDSITYRLRQNRSKSARSQLCWFVSATTLVGGGGYMLLFVPLFSLFTFMIFLDSRYLGVYKNCDPELQRLADTGQLSWWSVTPTLHRTFAVIADGIESIVTWIDGGTLAILVPCLVTIISYDLILCWRGIMKKIDSTLCSIKDINVPGKRQQTIVIYEQTASIQRAVHELHCEIYDFFKQTARADSIVSDYLSGILIAWLILFFTYTYAIEGHVSRQLPLSTFIHLSCLIVVFFLPCIGLLQLYAACWNSYPRLCSIMAHEPGLQKHKTILEFFVRSENCFTFLGQFRFGPVALLTTIGWTFSGFCIISSLVQDRYHLHDMSRPSEFGLKYQ